MKASYLLDTNVCVELLRGNADIAQAINKVGIENCCISELTVAELKFGEEYGRMKGLNLKSQGLSVFLDAMSIIPISSSIDLFACEKAKQKYAGRSNGDDFDLLIGCTAVVNGMFMVTHNTKHFKNIAGIELVDWM